MSLCYETQGSSTYLVYKLCDSDSLDPLSLGMIANNDIDGLAPILLTQKDEAKYLKYNVTAKIPASKFLAGPVMKKRLLGVFAGVADAILAAEEYMVDLSMFMLDLEYIFVDVTTCQTRLICLPICGCINNTVDLATFFKDIIYNIQLDQSEDTSYVTQIVSYLNGAAAFSLEGFSSTIKTLSVQAGQTYVPQSHVPQSRNKPSIVMPDQPIRQTAPQPHIYHPREEKAHAEAQNDTINNNNKDEKKVTFIHLMTHFSKETREAYVAQKFRGKQALPAPSPWTPTKAPDSPAWFSFVCKETPMPQPAIRQQRQTQQTQQSSQVHLEQATPPAFKEHPASTDDCCRNAPLAPLPLGQAAAGAGSTTDLGCCSALQEAAPYLIRIRTNERIILDKPIFRVGKEAGFVDYVISDNSAISRCHADFTIDGGECFISDMNSTNHTYVDGAMVQCGSNARLDHGATIKMANEEFEFRRY